MTIIPNQPYEEGPVIEVVMKTSAALYQDIVVSSDQDIFLFYEIVENQEHRTYEEITEIILSEKQF